MFNTNMINTVPTDKSNFSTSSTSELSKRWCHYKRNDEVAFVPIYLYWYYILNGKGLKIPLNYKKRSKNILHSSFDLKIPFLLIFLV